MTTVTSKNREEFIANELAKKSTKNKSNEPYYVKKTTIKKGMIGQQKRSEKDFYDVHHESEGHYARLPKEHHAHMVAYGLNKKYPEHSLGGFDDQTAEKIQKSMEQEGHPATKLKEWGN